MPVFLCFVIDLHRKSSFKKALNSSNYCYCKCDSLDVQILTYSPHFDYVFHRTEGLMQQIQEFRHLMTHKEIDPVTFFVPTQLRFGLFEVVAVSVFFYEFVLNPPSGHRHRV